MINTYTHCRTKYPNFSEGARITNRRRLKKVASFGFLYNFCCCRNENFIRVLLSRASRKGHKSAPYLRLKNSKTTARCQVIFNVSVAKHQKNEGGRLRKKRFRKSLTMPKKTGKGDSLVSPVFVCYAEKEKSLWFSFLGQMVQFDTIRFCTTL